MIQVSNLTKIYKLSKKSMKKEHTKKSVIKAVDNVSFSVNAGEIYGLLGPNGAGKTTILRCLATLLSPTEGEISVDGYQTIEDSSQVRSKIGFLTNEIKLDPQFTVDYMFDFFSELHNVPKSEIEERKKKLFEYFGILEFKNKKISELSTGMKQKAAIAVCLAHNPPIIIFDEPTSGLDILTARLVLDYLKQMKQEGKLVIVSTHIMTEAEKLCDRIGIIIDGKMVCDSTPKDIYVQYGTDNLEDAFFEMYKVNHKEEV